MARDFLSLESYIRDSHQEFRHLFSRFFCRKFKPLSISSLSLSPFFFLSFFCALIFLVRIFCDKARDVGSGLCLFSQARFGKDACR
jgi:hypothetical protein